MVMQLEELKNHLTPAQVEGIDEAELTVRLKYIEQVNKTFNEAQSKLEEENDVYIDVSTRMKFTSIYFEVKSLIARQK